MPRSSTKHLRGEVKPSKFKTSLCQYFIKGSECPFGDKCAFAHGDLELRSEQQNLSDLSPVNTQETPTNTICGEFLILPGSNTSSSRDLHTPPLAGSCISDSAPIDDTASLMSSVGDCSISIFRHNPYGMSTRGGSVTTPSAKIVVAKDVRV